MKSDLAKAGSGWLALLATTDLSCPYCSAVGDRLRKRAFRCGTCAGTIRPRHRQHEGPPKYYTQAGWFLVDALRRGELTPDIIAATSVGSDAFYSPHDDREVIARCDQAVEAVVAEFGAILGRTPTAEDVLRGYFDGRLSSRNCGSFRSAFDRYRFAEMLFTIGDAASAERELNEAIYQSVSSLDDPLGPPGWLRLFRKITGRDFARRDLDMTARAYGLSGASEDAWRTAIGCLPPLILGVDWLRHADGLPLVVARCRHCPSREVESRHDGVICSGCGAWLGTAEVLAARVRRHQERLSARLGDPALPPPKPQS